ncbi:sensor histidine kinase [Microbacterium sp. CJ88]|uniref:sensor histidine kinase n=1 Tax=Microbacterium sp. CJ88 TaxID=3445672 RepID=UPI003F65A9DD
MLLALGLIGAGIGTAVLMRNSLVSGVEGQARTLAASNFASQLLTLGVQDGALTATATPEAPPTDNVVAVYDPSGAIAGQAGGRGAAPPAVPDMFSLTDAYGQMQLGTTTRLVSATGDNEYVAAVTVQEYPSTGLNYTQLVAVPLAPVNRTIAQFLGIYGILTAIAIIAGAFLTRLLVTLAFRNLGQVESTAMAIAAGDFSQRMTDIEPGTEVGRLKVAVNTMLGRIDAALSQRDATVRQMRRFIGDASHELRTPLVTVRGYAELYRMGAITGDDDVAQAMERIEKEAVRMGVLVEDLLALARLDERRDVVVAPVDLRPIARDAAMDVRATSPQRTVTVIDTALTAMADASSPADSADASDPDADPDDRADGRKRGNPPTSAIARAGATLSLLRRRPRPVPATGATGAGESTPMMPGAAASVPLDPAAAPIVLGDENRIRQVVTNLLGNARRFTADDSPIDLRVGADAAARMGWIEVIDHGEGIPEQIRDKIFQRFWRADTSRTRETGGTGLGLSIVASIVDALHGTVDVTETPGGGATFRVSLPLAHERDAAEHLLIETQPLPRMSPPPAD